MISVSVSPKVVKPLHVGVADRSRIIDNPLRQVHDGDVDLVEAGGTVIEHDLEHRFSKPP